MSTFEPFSGFPAVTKATAIPNLFFASVMPEMKTPAELLAFLWVSHEVQVQAGEARFVTERQLWGRAALRLSFQRLGGGREGLGQGLRDCVGRGLLLAAQTRGPDGEEALYFVNNPAARRALFRVRAGELQLAPGTVVVESAVPPRPTIFRMYEEHIGTITPFVGERLVAAAGHYPAEWVEAAFRQAAELNRRNWRYIERILEKWEQEGRTDGTAAGDSLEERKRRFLGGKAVRAEPGS